MSGILRVAVPSNHPGGLDAICSDHFGHCDLYTIIDIKNKEITTVETLANVQHEAGGCMVPVSLLNEQNIDAIVVGGIGGRPLQGFNNAGIDVYYAERGKDKDVRSVAGGMISGNFPKIRADQVCQGGGNCQH